MVGFFPALRFLLGNQENDRSRLPLSWSPRGELGAGVDAAVGFLGWEWWGVSLCLIWS